MALLLRKIGRRGVWQKNPPDFIRLVKDVQPDANNTLSVWYIDDDRANLLRIVAALAITRDHFADFDYLLCKDDVLATLNLTIQQSPGKTPDDGANQQWHRDIRHYQDLCRQLTHPVLY